MLLRKFDKRELYIQRLILAAIGPRKAWLYACRNRWVRGWENRICRKNKVQLKLSSGLGIASVCWLSELQRRKNTWALQLYVNFEKLKEFPVKWNIFTYKSIWNHPHSCQSLKFCWVKEVRESPILWLCPCKNNPKIRRLPPSTIKRFEIILDVLFEFI